VAQALRQGDTTGIGTALVGICTPASEGTTRSRAGVAGGIEDVAAAVVVPTSKRPVATA